MRPFLVVNVLSCLLKFTQVLHLYFRNNSLQLDLIISDQPDLSRGHEAKKVLEHYVPLQGGVKLARPGSLLLVRQSRYNALLSNFCFLS